MGVELPFDIGQTVFVIIKQVHPATYHDVIVGYDHLGPIGGKEIISPETVSYSVICVPFTLDLLRKHPLADIYGNEMDANIAWMRRDFLNWRGENDFE